jgi:hypothetical protein
MSNQPPGPVRCPACQQKALPFQTHCLHCNARLPKAAPVETKADPTAALPRTDGVCPACGKALSATAVLCIDCGFDLRTGRMIETVRGPAAEESITDSARPKQNRHAEPLPAGLAKVRLGLGFHYARLVLTLLTVLVMMGLVCYGVAMRSREPDSIAIVGWLTAGGIVMLAALLGIVGSILCLWVGRASRAWWFIFISLLLDVLTPPLIVFLQLVAIPPFLAWGVEFASWICFMLFLRRLALYVDRPDEANEIMAFITRGVALLVGAPLLLILLTMMAFLGAFTSDAAVPVYLLATTLIIVVQLVFLILLFFGILANLQTLRATITSRLPRREETEAQPRAV